MADHNKQIWEKIAEREAYFGVFTDEKYLSAKLDGAARDEFFESGREHLDFVWGEFEKVLGKIDRPAKGLDYGCGVGRILLNLAARCDEVVGVDISETMLAEAKRNLEAAGIDVFRLRTADVFMSADGDEYDLVHSYIVLQHVDPRVGYGIIDKLLERLRPGGLGMIHVTHTDRTKPFGSWRSRAYRDVPGLHAITSLIRRRSEPFIPMYAYDMPRVREIMSEHGCSELATVETDHGYIGEMIFLQKAR